MFLAEVGKNSRGAFLLVIKTFQGGRKMSVKVLVGVEGKGWKQFERGMRSLLIHEYGCRLHVGLKSGMDSVLLTLMHGPSWMAGRATTDPKAVVWSVRCGVASWGGL